VVATNVEHLGALSQSPDVGPLQVLEVVVVRRTERRAERAVVASDDDGAPAGRHLGVDPVLDTQADGADGVLEDGGVLVVADAADVDHAVGRENVLGAAGRVLGGAAGDELGIVVVEEVLVDGEVAVLGEDGVVGLEVVLGQEGVITGGLDVCGKVLATLCFVVDGIQGPEREERGGGGRGPSSPISPSITGPSAKTGNPIFLF
jgi:hypothetical protein